MVIDDLLIQTFHLRPGNSEKATVALLTEKDIQPAFKYQTFG